MSFLTTQHSWIWKGAIVVGAASIVLTGCSAAGSGSSSPAAGGTTVNIGLVANLTGTAAESYGIPFQRGVEAALADVKTSGVLTKVGITPKLVTADAKSDVADAVTAFNTINQQNAPIVLQDSQSPLGQAIAPIANDSKVTFISGAGSALEDKAGYAFRFTDLLTTTAATSKYLVAQGDTKVGAIVASDNPSFAALASATEAGLPKGFAAKQVISSTDTDFSAVLENLRSAHLDAVVLSALPAQVGNILVQMKQAGGFTNVTKVGTLATSAETYTIAGTTAKGLVFPQSWAPGTGTATSKAFEASYKKKYGEVATSYAGLGYQIGWIVAADLLNAHKSVTGTTLRDGLPAASTSALVQKHSILNLTLKKDGSAISNGVLAEFDSTGTVVSADVKK